METWLCSNYVGLVFRMRHSEDILCWPYGEEGFDWEDSLEMYTKHTMQLS